MEQKHDVQYWKNLKPRASYMGLEIQLIKKGITKTELRQALGFSSGTLAKFRKGEFVSLELLLKIAVYLNCSVGDLVDVHPADRIKPKP